MSFVGSSVVVLFSNCFDSILDAAERAYLLFVQLLFLFEAASMVLLDYAAVNRAAGVLTSLYLSKLKVDRVNGLCFPRVCEGESQNAWPSWHPLQSLRACVALACVP